jgi:hypothetical protein
MSDSLKYLNGYIDAFIQIAKELGIDAPQPISPKRVFEEQLLPRLRALIAGSVDGPKRPAVEGWSGWATQYPGELPKLWGAREIAELNWWPDEGQRLFRVVEDIAASPTATTVAG